METKEKVTLRGKNKDVGGIREEKQEIRKDGGERVERNRKESDKDNIFGCVGSVLPLAVMSFLSWGAQQRGGGGLNEKLFPACI